MWSENVDLLAYHDLDGRSGFKLALQEAEGRFFLYVAGFWQKNYKADRRSAAKLSLNQSRGAPIYLSEGNSGIYILTHNPS